MHRFENLSWEKKLCKLFAFLKLKLELISMGEAAVLSLCAQSQSCDWLLSGSGC